MERPVPVDGCFAGRRSGDGSGTTGATMRAMTRRILLVLTAAGGLTLALATPAGAVTGSWTVMPAQPAVNARRRRG